MNNNLNISTEIPTNLIYKSCILDEFGNTNKIIIFQGNEEKEYIFTNEELLHIKDKNIKIIKSKQHIHNDDSIYNIKRKILNELDKDTVYEELYLFTSNKKPLELYKLYKIITNDSKIPLTKQMLGQILWNLKKENINNIIENIPDKNDYNYNDLISIFKDINDDFKCVYPLGIQFTSYYDYRFSGNPYDILNSTQSTFKMTTKNVLLPFENSLLLNYPNIINNYIYVCTANNLLQYCNNNQINNKYIIDLYFPLLNKYEINDYDSYINKKNILIKSNKKDLDQNVNKIYNNVNLLHNIYYSTQTSLNFVSKGIQNINLIIHPEKDILLPLDLIFKQINANEKMLFIKYNPGIHKEDMYRLYSSQISKNNKKIPYLSKSIIISLSKIYGKNKQISIYLNTTEDVVKLFMLNINANGNLTINVELNNVISEEKMNSILNENVNYVINNINDVIQFAGYKLALFQNIQNTNIEIINIDYIWKISQSKIIDLNKYVNMFKGIFNIIDNNFFIYKRVENYFELDEINTIISQNYKQPEDIHIIKNILTSNFSISTNEADEKIKQFLNDHTFINGQYVNKSITKTVNPGVPCILKELPFENNITVEAKELNNMKYIDTLEIYIHNLFLITQLPDLLPIPLKDLLNIFKPLNKVVEIVPNVVPKIIQPYTLPNNDNINDSPDIDDAFMFDSDSSDDGSNSDSDSDSDSDDNSQQLGGAYTKFLKKMKHLDPTLFLSKKKGQYDAYSRLCPANISRQPIILTQEEKDNIDKNYPDSYKVALPYSSKSKNTKYWYICPRYWCIKQGENRPLSEEEVKNGECGGKIIPKEATDPPPGHYIYEFTDSKIHKNHDGTYRDHYPGFLEAEKHPTDCLPCCFKKMFSNDQLKRRSECNVNDEDLSGDINTIRQKENDDKKVIPKITNKDIKKNPKNIFDFNKFPISENRWGFLPLPLQQLFNIDYKKYISNNDNSLIKKNEQPLLRYGVYHRSEHQSFIACISDLYSKEKTLTISELCNEIIKITTIDIFSIVQNCSLITIFQSNKKGNINNYKKSDIYKNTNLNNKDEVAYLNKLISSYENFIQFLKDEDSFIDYTYLWDIITSKDFGLFPNGLNLVILEILDNDNTDNIQLLCPTNSYNKTLFNPDYETTFIVKRDDLFEPLYLYGNTFNNNLKLSHAAVKFFNVNNIPPTMKNILNNIQNSTNQYCKTIVNKNLYTFDEPLHANIIYDILLLHKFIIKNQVINFNGKTIGFEVSIRDEDNLSVYLPCYPSARIYNLTTIYINDLKWLDYFNTVKLLNNINTVTNNVIKSKPKIKVIEDGLIVGILTETNQFIQLSTFEPNTIDDNLNSIQMNSYKNYYDIDKTLMLSDATDNTRVNTVQKISLENQFYLAFRSKIRTLLSEYYNLEIHNNIVKIIDDPRYLYQSKIEKIIILLKHLMRNSVSFELIESNILNTMNNLSTFITRKDINQFCLEKENVLCLPKNNLINNIDNSTLYFTRMADELLRFKRVQLFMLNTNEYMNISNTEYIINDNELFLLQTILFGNYFNDLDLKHNDKYIKNNSYDTAIPNDISNAIKKSNNISL